jgi:hypothetical protein
VITAALDVYLGKRPLESAPQLTADDPLLSGFPTITTSTAMRRDDPDDSPFIRLVTDSIADVWQLSPFERVHRIRTRMTQL